MNVGMGRARTATVDGPNAERMAGLMPEPAKDSVLMQVDALAREIDELRVSIHAMSDALAPIMGPDFRNVVEAKPSPPQPIRAQLFESLEQCTTTILNLRCDLDALRHRLAL